MKKYKEYKENFRGLEGSELIALRERFIDSADSEDDKAEGPSRPREFKLAIRVRNNELDNELKNDIKQLIKIQQEVSVQWDIKEPPSRCFKRTCFITFAMMFGIMGAVGTAALVKGLVSYPKYKSQYDNQPQNLLEDQSCAQAANFTHQELCRGKLEESSTNFVTACYFLVEHTCESTLGDVFLGTISLLAIIVMCGMMARACTLKPRPPRQEALRSYLSLEQLEFLTQRNIIIDNYSNIDSFGGTIASYIQENQPPEKIVAALEKTGLFRRAAQIVTQYALKTEKQVMRYERGGEFELGLTR